MAKQNMSKKYPDEWYSKLCKKVDDAIMENIDKINLFVCSKIALETLNGLPCYKVNHNSDPYYDHSGTLEEEKVIKVPDLNTIVFSEFCSMYSGDTIPTFCSGYGLAYTDYSESVDEWVTDAAFFIQDKIIAETILDQHPELAEDNYTLENAVFEIRDEIDDETMVFSPYEILGCLPLQAENWTLDIIRKKGLFLAKQIEENRKEHFKEEQEAKNKLQQKAEALTLKAGMPRVFGKNRGFLYITKNDYEALSWLKSNYTPDEIELLIISRKIFVSNSLDSEYHSLRSNLEYDPEIKAPLFLEFSLIYDQ